MFAGLCGSLGRAGREARCVVVTETRPDQSAFLLHHFVHQQLAAGGKVVLAGLEQTFGHFHSVAARQGLSLVKEREAGRLVFYEGLVGLLQFSEVGREHLLSLSYRVVGFVVISVMK